MERQIAYKVLTGEEFVALREGAFAGAPVDVADGYIHLSAASQVTETVAKHFAGQSGLVVAAVDLAALGNAVRWEESRNKELFPHLYGRLTMDAVMAHCPLGWEADGSVTLPGMAARLGG
jgi:uncharacterized protein (DUF952 family)